MTCITCHDPHRPQPSAVVERKCLACHSAADCSDRPRLAVEVRDDCTGCHMPARVWMNVHFHTADDRYAPVAPRIDHRIGVHPEAKQAVLLAWLRERQDAKSRAEAKRVATELAGYWLKQADERTAQGRLLAALGAVREAGKAKPDEETRRRLHEAISRQSEFDALRKQVDPRRPEAAIDVLKKILQIRPGYAAAHSQLGAAYASLGDHQNAVHHLSAVAEHDPDDASGMTLLAWMAYVDGRPEEAVALYAKADSIEPASATIQYEWGLALLKLERWSEAESRLRRALRLHPRHEGARQALREALEHQGRTDEGK